MKKMISKNPMKKFNKTNLLTKINNAKKYLRLSFWRNNLSFLIAIFIFIAVHVGLITYVLIVRANANSFTKLARVPGMLLNFDSVLILLLVLRRLSTYLRNSEIGRRIAVVDEFLSFHKILGFLIAFLGLLHSFGHFFNFWYLSRDYMPMIPKPSNETDHDDFKPNPAPTYAELLFTTKSGIGWVEASACPTGWALLAILALMIGFALPCVRRKGHFQLFYYTHYLYVAYFAILIIHAPNFWKWFIGIFVLALFERILTFMRINSIKYGDFYIKDVNLLPSRVTNLVISCPREFRFKAGDYVFINLPRLAKHEWHPFTISSAPEQEGILTVHIRSLGHWTNKIYDFFENLSLEATHFSVDQIIHDDKFRVESNIKTDNKKVSLNSTKRLMGLDMNISVDGPYGTASRRIMDCEHVVLISAGIGVTPFASILQSLWFKFSRSLKTCSKCSHHWFDHIDMKLFKKVDFIWTNRDFSSFEWFVELLSEIELQQMNSGSDRIIDMHLFMTSAKINQLIRKYEENSDLDKKLEENFSLRLNPGRPNYDQLFDRIKSENKGKVHVFFCGPPDLGTMVGLKSSKYGFKFSKEYF